MWKKKADEARLAWEAATRAAKTFGDSIESKAVHTPHERARLEQLIESVRAAKDEYERLSNLAEFEDEQDHLDLSRGRKTRNGFPGIIASGSRGGSSRPLMLTNIFKASLASGGSLSSNVFREFANEEFDFSERLKAAGYQTERFGSWLYPLGEEYLMEPVNELGQKMADFSQLRKELRERETIAPDPGEVGWLLKRNPQFASETFGLERKDMLLGDPALGGVFVPVTLASRVIDFLRNRSVLMRAGATEFPLPSSGNLTLPRLNSDPSFAYVDPDTLVDMATTNIGTGSVVLKAKSLRGAVTVPNDMIRYSTPAVELLVRSALASKAAVAEDFQFLEGTGSAIAPKGIINYTKSAAETPTSNQITLHVATTVGANGDTIQPEDIAKIIGLFYSGNDTDAPTAWIMRPMLWAAIQNRRADAVSAADSKGPFLFSIDRGSNQNEIPASLGGFPVVSSVQMSANRVKGSGTNLNYIFFGNFRRMLLGRAGAIELAASEHVKFLQDKTIVRCILRSDVVLEHEESFVFTDTLLTA